MLSTFFSPKLQNFDESSMPGIVFHALSNIVKLVPKRQKEFRDECQMVIDRILAEDAALKPGQQADTDADKYFYPFKLACEDKRAKVRLYALDAISKMISYGYLVGNRLADPVLYPPTVHSAKVQQSHEPIPSSAIQTLGSGIPPAAAGPKSPAGDAAKTTDEEAAQDAGATVASPKSVDSSTSDGSSHSVRATSNSIDEADAESAERGLASPSDPVSSDALPDDEPSTATISEVASDGVSTSANVTSPHSESGTASSASAAEAEGQPVIPRTRRRLLIDAIIEAVYDCCTSDDEGVQLQVIRCFVNAVSTAKCQVHDHSLLLTVRACYHIYLTSRSHINRDTAKAGLYQMLITAFQRMETLAAHISYEQSQREQRRAERRATRAAAKPEEPANATEQKDVTVRPEDLPSDLELCNEDAAEGDEDLDDDEDDEAYSSVGDALQDPESKELRSSATGPSALSLIAPSKDSSAIPISAAHAAAYAAARSEDDDSGLSSTINPTLDPALLAADPGYIVSPAPSPRQSDSEADAPGEEDPTVAREVQRKRLRITRRRKAREERERLAIKLATLQHDAYLIFRALCKLAAKPITEDSDYPTRSKILSLELLHSILRNPGPTLCFFPPFVTLIRDELLYALAVNCLLPVEEVYRLAAAIWRSLVLVFRAHIKVEMCSFMLNIVLEILSHPNTSFDHRMTALDVIVSMARDPRLIVDLYLNYDCDEKYPDVFHQITTALERIAMSRGNEMMTREEEIQLKALAMEGQNSIMRSMVIWCRDALAFLGNKDPEKRANKPFKLSTRDLKGNPLDKDDNLYEAVRALGPKSAPGPMVVPYATVGANGEIVPPSTDPHEDGEASPEVPAELQPLELQKSITATMNSLKDAPVAFERTGPRWEAAEKRLSKFEEARRRKKVINMAIHKINDKPKAGFAYLVQNGILKKDPHEFAAFVIETPGLDRVVMGEYFGDADPFNLEVLKAYAELSDFRGLTLDAAISKYFSKFLVRGEAQRIDRAIQIFANRYCADNPGVFRSTDGCWILSFSTVMLHSDAHSPGVKNRMTKEEFFRNNRGLDDKHDFNPELLSGIYDRVTTEGLKIEDVVQERKNWASMPPRRRQIQYLQDTQRLTRQWVEAIRRRLALFKQAYERRTKAKAEQEGRPEDAPVAQGATAPSLKSALQQRVANQRLTGADLPMGANGRCLRTALAVEQERARILELTMYEAEPEDIDAVRSMFEVVWQSACATFSILLEETEDPRVVQLCLDGYRYAIRISSMFQATVAREALINSLAKCTQLGTQRELRPKNIEAIKMVLKIAHTEGNYLGESWAEVLMVISEYERLQIIARSGASGALDVFQATDAHVRKAQTAVSGRAVAQLLHTGGEQVNTREALANKYHISQQVIEKIDPGLVERVFSQSGLLTDAALIDFIDQLRNVAEFELFSATPSRVISLQKILEVTYYNLSRPTAIWAKIWTILAGFFKRVGCHQNPTVAMYGVDILRQLVSKFIDKPQHVSSGLQDIMFDAFGSITSQSPSEDVRELVVQCLATFVAARPNEIREGWYPIFRALTHAAEEHSPRIVSAAFNLVQTILNQHFIYISGGQYEALDECVRALTEFGLNRHVPKISTLAVECLGRCAQHLGNVARAKRHGTPLPCALPVSSNSGDLPDTPAKDSDTTPEDLSQSASPSANSTQTIAASSTCSNASTFIAPAPFDGPSQTLNVWVLILTGLSALVSDPRLEVRTRALQTLFRVLHVNGAYFTPSFWRLVYREVLIPMFDEVRTVGQRRAAPPPPPPPPPMLPQPQANVPAPPRMPPPAASVANSTVASPPAAQPPQTQGAAMSSPGPSSPNSAIVRTGSVSAGIGAVSSPQDGGSATPVADSQAHMRRPSTVGGEGMELRGSFSGRTEVSSSPVPPMSSVPMAPAASSQQGSPAVPPRPVTRAGTSSNLMGQGAASAGPALPPTASPAQIWLHTTCMTALQSLIELFARFHSMAAFMLPEVLELIGGCITQSDEDLACIGVKCWLRLLQVCGNDFSVDEWTLVFQHFNRMFAKCLPMELISPTTRRALGLPPMYEGPFESVLEQVNRATILKNIAIQSLNVAPSPDHPDATGPTEPESAARLSFQTGPIVTKCKTQLVLMDGVVDFFVHYFASFYRHPKSKVTQAAVAQAFEIQGQRGESIPPSPVSSVQSLDTSSTTSPASSPSGPGSPSSTTSSTASTVTNPPVIANLLDEHLFAVLDTLLLAVDFAQRFNCDYALRRRLWVAGFLSDRQKLLPELYFHGSHAMKLYMTLLIARLSFAGEPAAEYIRQIHSKARSSAAASPLHSKSQAHDGSPAEVAEPKSESVTASDLTLNTDEKVPLHAQLSGKRGTDLDSPVGETGSESSATLLCKALSDEGVVPLVPHTDLDAVNEIRQRFMDLMLHVFGDYSVKVREGQEDARRCLDVVLCSVFDSVGSLLVSSQQLDLIGKFMPNFLVLIQEGSPEVRDRLARLLALPHTLQALVRGCEMGASIQPRGEPQDTDTSSSKPPSHTEEVASHSVAKGKKKTANRS